MYKTVRHGENCLHYTILPQTEEVITNSGMKGIGRDYSPSIHVRRCRKKNRILKFILGFAFGTFISFALVCVPVYLINHALIDRWLDNQATRDGIVSSSPTEHVIDWDPAKTYKKDLKAKPDVGSTAEYTTSTSTATTTSYATSTLTIPTVPQAVTADTSTPPWIVPALKSWKSSSTILTIPTEGNEISSIMKSKKKELTDIDNMSIKPWEKDIIIRPTVTPESITLNSVIKYYSRSYVSEKPLVTNTKLFDDVLITTKKPTTVIPVTTEVSTEPSKLKDLKDAILSVDDDDDFKESLEVDEVFSLPPLKPESPNSDSDEVTVSKAEGGWYGARWPFVDTSSYFQWTGYSPGDNLLLPLLVAALSSIALVLLLALAVRRRRRTLSSQAQNAIAAESQVDDNTNLLTAENGEDAEE